MVITEINKRGQTKADRKVKNHTVYSDKLRLSMVDLTYIDLATEDA